MAILPGINREQALMILERIKETISENPIIKPIGLITLSLSIGGAIARPSDSEPIENLVSKADSELMKVKRSGKGNFSLF